MKRDGVSITVPPSNAAAPSKASPVSSDPAFNSRDRSRDVSRTGALIVNADDWGRDVENTDRTLECIVRRMVSSVSAMVFMKDSERAAEIAHGHGVDAGLHLNFTTEFSASGTPSALIEHQRRVSRYLGKRRLSQVVFHPGLTKSFQYVVAAQCDEYCRLYGAQPKRIDGHHHMHLCANVLLQKLLPPATIVRRNFSFQPGEKSVWNRRYRRSVDKMLARRHNLTDYFFSLPPLEPRARIDRMRELSRRFIVEVETHPVKKDEYDFLTGHAGERWAMDAPIANSFSAAMGSRAVRRGE